MRLNSRPKSELPPGAVERALLASVRVGLALVLLTPLVWAPETWYPFAVGKAVYARSTIAVTFALWAVLALMHPRWRPPPGALLLALGASLAVAALSAALGVSLQRSLWSTYTRMEGLVDLAHWYAFALVLAATLRETGDWFRLLNLNLCVALVVAAVAILSFYAPETPILAALPAESRYPRISGTTGNPLFLGAYMQAAALLAAGFLARSWLPQPPPGGSGRRSRTPRTRTRPWPARLFWAVTAISAVIALALSGSMGALAGLLSGVGGAMLYVWLGNSPWPRRYGLLGLAAMATIASALLLVLALRAAALDSGSGQRAFDNILLERVTSVVRIGDSLRPRVDSWQAGLAAFAERPLLGWGTGNYFVAAARHISPTRNSNRIDDHAHNEIIEEAASKGVAGLAAYFLLWGLTASVILRGARAGEPGDRALAVAAGAVFVGWFVQGQTSFHSAESLLHYMLLLGFSIRLESNARAAAGKGAAPGFRRLRITMRCAAAAGALALAVVSLSANRAVLQGAGAVYDAELSGEFLKDMERSMRAFEPLANGPRVILFNNLAANWGILEARDADEARRLLAWSRAEADAALATEPQSWVIHHALTRLYRAAAATRPELGEQAQFHFERSLQLAPNLDPLEAPLPGGR